MAAPPQPPTVGKALLNESEPLKAYHAVVAPFFDQLRDAFGSLNLRDNHGAVVTDPAALTAGADGALSATFVSSGFTPLLVFFRAEELDTLKRPTGIVVGGSAQWNASPREGHQGFQVVRAPGLTTGKLYAVTFVALPG